MTLPFAMTFHVIYHDELLLVKRSRLIYVVIVVLGRLSLELALFKTYSVPTISKILAATGEFSKSAAKRAEDTGLILVRSPSQVELDDAMFAELACFPYIGRDY